MDEREERAVVTRIRLDVFICITTFGLQGAFLANALHSGNGLGPWVLWGVILLFSAAVIVFAMRRASRLSKRWRQHKWGEK
jgi:hypothetical protein